MTYAPVKVEAAMSNGLDGNAFTRNIDLTLTQGQGQMKHFPLHHVTMYLQSLKLLRPMVEDIHYQENTLFDLEPKVKVTQNVAQYHRLHVTFARAKFDVATFHG